MRSRMSKTPAPSWERACARPCATGCWSSCMWASCWGCPGGLAWCRCCWRRQPRSCCGPCSLGNPEPGEVGGDGACVARGAIPGSREWHADRQDVQRRRYGAHWVRSECATTGPGSTGEPAAGASRPACQRDRRFVRLRHHSLVRGKLDVDGCGTATRGVHGIRGGDAPPALAREEARAVPGAGEPRSRGSRPGVRSPERRSRGGRGCRAPGSLGLRGPTGVP